MRILVVSNVYPPDVVGGAELVAHEGALAYARQGHEVRAFAGDLHAPRARYSRTDDAHDGIPVSRIALVPEDYSPEFLNFHHPVVEAHFGDVQRAFAPDVVHCHNLPGLSVKLAMLARESGARVVCTLHDFWGFCPRNTAVRPEIAGIRHPHGASRCA
jgi:glycosyltransferase involved in cell wall biosynthesis